MGKGLLDKNLKTLQAASSSEESAEYFAHVGPLLPSVLEPSSPALHCIPAASRVGGQFLVADKDFPVA